MRVMIKETQRTRRLLVDDVHDKTAEVLDNCVWLRSPTSIKLILSMTWADLSAMDRPVRFYSPQPESEFLLIYSLDCSDGKRTVEIELRIETLLWARIYSILEFDHLVGEFCSKYGLAAHV